MQSLGDKVTPRAKPGKEAEEHALHDFIQSMPSPGGNHSPIIANSALDAAFECQFDEPDS